MKNKDLQQLKTLALAASPGPWKGDRIDGSIKYDLLDVNGDTVIAGNNRGGDDSYGIVGDDNEAYLMTVSPDVILALIERIESLAAPAVANGAAEPIPKAWMRKWYADGEVPAKTKGRWPGKFKFKSVTDNKIFRDDIPLFAIAASTQQAAPKQALTDEQIYNFMNLHFGYGPVYGEDAAQHFALPREILAFSRAIEAASATNALLAVALKDIIEMNRQTAEDQYGDANKAESWCCVKTARAALASVPTAPEA